MQIQSQNRQFRFTEDRVRELVSQGKKLRFRDTEIRGLVVTLTASGTKTYDVYKKPRGGGSVVNVRIGVVGEMTLKKAREASLSILAQLKLGVNPNKTFAEYNQAGLTLQKALNEYIQAKHGKSRAGTIKQYSAAIYNYSPELLNRKMKDITRADIQRIHDKISRGQCVWTKPNGALYRMKKPSPSQANHWARTMRAIFNYVMEVWRTEGDQPLIVSNPVKVLSTLKLWNSLEPKVTRIGEHQLTRFFDTLDTFRAQVKLTTELAISDALEMAIFTGLRLNEIMRLTKDRVDFKTGVFWINETKNGESLELPLTDSVKKILERRHNAVPLECIYLFPSKCGTKPIQDPKKTVLNLKKLSSQGNDEALSMNFHDMRRTFASIAESVGVGTYMIKRLVNHKLGVGWDVTEQYMHFSAADLKKHATKVEMFILEKSGRINSSNDSVDVLLMTRLADLDENKKRSLLELLSIL